MVIKCSLLSVKLHIRDGLLCVFFVYFSRSHQHTHPQCGRFESEGKTQLPKKQKREKERKRNEPAEEPQRENVSPPPGGFALQNNGRAQSGTSAAKVLVETAASLLQPCAFSFTESMKPDTQRAEEQTDPAVTCLISTRGNAGSYTLRTNRVLINAISSEVQSSGEG